MKHDPNLRLGDVPISGAVVCRILRAAFAVEDMCELMNIETLCSSNCAALGDLWRRVVQSGLYFEKMSIGALVQTLSNADQVITLHVRDSGDRHRQILVEDGEILVNTLDRQLSRQA